MRYCSYPWSSFKGDHRMKTLSKNLLLILAAALLIQIAHAQAAPTKNATPKPAASPSQYLLDSWNDIGRKLIAMAEDFPEDKYDFKPNPAQRSFAEQLLHAANANYFFTDPAMGKKMPAEEDPKRADYKTKADIVCRVLLEKTNSADA